MQHDQFVFVTCNYKYIFTEIEKIFNTLKKSTMIMKRKQDKDAEIKNAVIFQLVTYEFELLN